MAETLEINQMLANKVEHKRQFRWILSLDGIDAFTARTMDRPKKQFEETVVDYVNQKVYYAGKGEWQQISISLHDPIAPSQAQKVTNWLRMVHDDPTGRMGYAEFYKKDFSLKLLDPVGNVVEKWNCIGGWPTNVDFGQLDYSSSETAQITVQIRADEWRLEF